MRSGDAPGPIVSAAWLGEHLDDPDLTLVQIGTDRVEYERAHLPGAVFVHGYDDFTVERDGIRALVASGVEIGRALGRIGIDKTKRVVFYAAQKSMWPARGYWTLRYYRWARVHLADGSLEALSRAGLPSTTTEPVIVAATCDLGPRDESVYASTEAVLAVAEGGAPARVVDCRSDAEWVGASSGSHEAPRKGRIPRAVHLNWELLVDDDGRFRPTEQLRSLYAAAGIDGSLPVFPYCGGGIRSAVSWFVMHELLGWENARNYDGSWAEWSRRPELPIERD